MSALDDKSLVPLYEQLQAILLDEIAVMAEGDRLPPERELQERYNVSRATVRTTLDHIEKLGWINRIQGVGTIVTKPKIQPEILKLTSFTEDIRARGMKPGSRTLSFELVAAPPSAVKRLNIADGTKILEVERLRLANDVPVGIHRLYIPPSLQVSLLDVQNVQSYYDLLREKLGLEPYHAVQQFSAKNADVREAELLGIEVGSALLAIERVTYTEDNIALEFVSFVYRADRYEYSITLYRE